MEVAVSALELVGAEGSLEGLAGALLMRSVIRRRIERSVCCIRAPSAAFYLTAISTARASRAQSTHIAHRSRLPSRTTPHRPRNIASHRALPADHPARRRPTTRHRDCQRPPNATLPQPLATREPARVPNHVRAPLSSPSSVRTAAREAPSKPPKRRASQARVAPKRAPARARGRKRPTPHPVSAPKLPIRPPPRSPPIGLCTQLRRRRTYERTSGADGHGGSSARA
ncbi:hypothetical protein C8Q78DRAFT_201836 [Trametes maxima]|nr:hypothetical protein C8Q78DRAFT_201836 [Trametes maxima]